MAESTTAIDESTLKRTLHGWPVEDTECLRCHAPLPRGEPVLFSIYQVTELPLLERYFEIPEGWLPGKVRCRSCEVDALEPATEGFNEALLMAELAERDGAVSIDATSMSLVETSPGTEGYLRPPVVVGYLAVNGELSIARWFKVQTILDAPDLSDAAVTPIQEAVSKAPEGPPGLIDEIPDDAYDNERLHFPEDFQRRTSTSA